MLIITVIGRTGGQRDILPRARTLINQSPLSQTVPRLEVESAPLALDIRSTWSPAVRSLDPINADPAQVREHRVHKFAATARPIQIFVAQNQLPTMLRRAPGRDPERPRMTKMKKPGGRRRKAPAVDCAFGIVRHG